MKKRVYMGAAAIIALILFLGGMTIRNIVYPENRNTISNVSSALNTPQETEVDNATSKVSNAPKVDKVPEIIKYVVKSGDNLGSLAAIYKVSIDTIALSNSISVDSLLKVGQELRFPSVDGILYKVKSGETLSDISNTYDVNISDITGDNGITSPDKLKIDQELIIAGVKSYKETKTASSTAASKGNSTVTLSSAKSTSIGTVKLASRGGTSVKPISSGLWPVKGPITSGFAMRWGKHHNGIDISAPTGTDVHAYMGGKVVFSGWDNGGYGNLVIIDHGNGLRTYYGHNSKLLVSSGQSVSAGQHIADVGSTGDSTGPHSHFEIRKNGTPVNPMPYLR